MQKKKWDRTHMLKIKQRIKKKKNESKMKSLQKQRGRGCTSKTK